MANTKVTSNVIADNAVGITQLNVSDGSDGQALVTNGAGTLSFATVGVSGISSSADATAITIDSSERVGIKKTPTKELDVAGTIKAVGATNNNTMEVFGAETSNQSFGLLVNAGTSSSDYCALFRDEDANTVLKIQGDGKVGIGTTSSAYKLEINGGSQTAAYFEGSDAGYTQGAICVASDTTDTNGYRGQGMFYFNHGSDTTWYTGGLYTAADRWDICRKSSTTALDESTAQATNSVFSVMPSGGGCAVGINNNNPAAFAYFVVQPKVTSGTAFQLHNQAGYRRWFYIIDGYYGYQGVEQIYSNGGVNRYFNNASGSTVGSIVVNSGSTAFNTTSDYRLKDNPQPLTGSGDFIDALQPKTWTWNHGDGGTGVGFIAHEAATVGHGLCVTGEKDAESLDKVWNEETEEYEEEMTPTYQQLDYSSGELIANMVAELQSLRARVAELEQN